MKELFREIEVHMKHYVDHFHHELKRLRTGRASLAILEPVVVDYYGTTTPLNQVAHLSVADASLIVAQPYDPSTIPAIQRGITQANLGLNPSSDGKVVRIPIPPLTEDRRKDLVRKAHDFAETGRNGVRQARRDGNDKLKAQEKKHEISQDDERRGLDEVQRLHDHYIKDINEALAHKEKDILTL
ncbi:MAG TPA: ribosome recycling factor [Thermoanaerobaculia bacterium]|nr:ribosome recycling factor [Thermoanaerobaculia bacterium]